MRRTTKTGTALLLSLLPSLVLSLVLSLAGSIIAGAVSQSASARTYKVLYSFCAEAGCTDGSGPQAGVIMDGAGVLYGTTRLGGDQFGGAVFKLVPNAAKTTWTETVLYSFCKRDGLIDCIDGKQPYAPLVRDRDGNLFGTASAGGRYCNPTGARGCGVAFALIYQKAIKTYAYRVMHVFCTDGPCSDGSTPYAGMILDSAGTLFGTTNGGSTNGDYGNVFRLTPNANDTKWTRKTLHKFCNQGFCSDGETPYGPVMMDARGNLYGTTWGGTIDDGGVVFQLAFDKAANRYTHKRLHAFCARTNCADGAHPTESLLMDSAGALYGTTARGGKYKGKGTVYRLVPNATKTAWTHQVLYNFCSRAGCVDGWEPNSNLVMDRAGNIYGVARSGGTKNKGAVFQLTPNAAKTAWTYKIIYSFCKAANCTDGAISDVDTAGGLIIDAAGHLYGTTARGGAHDGGTVWRLANN